MGMGIANPEYLTEMRLIGHGSRILDRRLTAGEVVRAESASGAAIESSRPTRRALSHHSSKQS